MNIALSYNIKSAILQNPGQFQMAHLFSTSTRFGVPTGCGTSACIAGWAVMLANKIPTAKEAAELWKSSNVQLICARDALQISNSSSERLFFSNMWPEEFQNAFFAATTPEAAAQAAADRIDYFITNAR